MSTSTVPFSVYHSTDSTMGLQKPRRPGAYGARRRRSKGSIPANSVHYRRTHRRELLQRQKEFFAERAARRADRAESN